MWRIEELLQRVSSSTARNDVNSVELELLSHLAADYEDLYYPVMPLTLAEVLRLRMAERNLTQKSLASVIGVSPARISEYITGKSEPTLSIAREMSRKLNIDAHIILGI